METKDYLHTHLEEIEAWEKDQKGLGFWEKLGRLPFKVLDKLTPAFIQEKITIIKIIYMSVESIYDTQRNVDVVYVCKLYQSYRLPQLVPISYSAYLSLY